MNNPGVINVFKEKGFTSHDVVAILRKLFGLKAGHTGTLDPNAQGVLPICLGKATKLADFIMASDKTYEAEVILGIETDTADITGTIIKQVDNVHVSVDDFKQVLQRFVGDIEQIPPMYSAIKIKGKKLYELAREGKTIERKPRQVRIDHIRLLSHNEAENRFFIKVACSKGTYIRSLCTDIGTALGCPASMGELTRTRSGFFFAKDAVLLTTLKEAAQLGTLHNFIIPVDKILPYPRAVVRNAGLSMALNGNALPTDVLEATVTTEKVWLYTPNNQLIGLFAIKGATLRAEVMM